MTEAAGMVYVVDDDRAIRDALGSLIRSIGLGVATFGTAQEFLGHPRGDGPSCVVLDVQLPDGSGLEIPAQLRRADVTIPIIFITGHGTIPMSVRAMKSGAMEFLTKPFQEEDLIGAIRVALERDRATLSDRAQLAGLRARMERLTPRERDVLALIVTGKLNKQIAAELGTAEQTIKQHRGRVMQKLEVDSLAELVRVMERAAGQPWVPSSHTKVP
jgi:FixJ family two-component response regulator